MMLVTKTSHEKLNFLHDTFLPPISYIRYTFISMLWDLNEKNFKSKLKLQFHYTKHSMSPLFCNRSWKDRDTRKCNKSLCSCVMYDLP